MVTLNFLADGGDGYALDTLGTNRVDLFTGTESSFTTAGREQRAFAEFLAVNSARPTWPSTRRRSGRRRTSGCRTCPSATTPCSRTRMTAAGRRSPKGPMDAALLTFFAEIEEAFEEFAGQLGVKAPNFSAIRDVVEAGLAELDHPWV
ncbi:hypothetical protein ACFQU2_18020 [Siccirubricoccus deserti]